MCYYTDLRSTNTIWLIDWKTDTVTSNSFTHHSFPECQRETLHTPTIPTTVWWKWGWKQGIEVPQINPTTNGQNESKQTPKRKLKTAPILIQETGKKTRSGRMKKMAPPKKKMPERRRERAERSVLKACTPWLRSSSAEGVHFGEINKGWYRVLIFLYLTDEHQATWPRQSGHFKRPGRGLELPLFLWTRSHPPHLRAKSRGARENADCSFLWTVQVLLNGFSN